MPPWFSLKDNVIFGGLTLLPLICAIYAQTQNVPGAASVALWGTTAGFALVWGLMNFWMWRAYVARQQEKGDR